MTTIKRICEECGSEFEQDQYTEAYDTNGPQGIETRPAQVWKICKHCAANIPDPMADTFAYLGLK